MDRKAHTGFRDRRIQPLCHLSGGATKKLATLAPTRSEERPEEIGGFLGQEPRFDLGSVVQAWFAEHVEHAAGGAGLWVQGAEDHTRNAGEDDRPGAHRTRLERHVHDRIEHSPASQRPGGIELLVGIVTDPVWGQVLAVGLGGVWVEILRDTAVLVLQVDRDQIRQALEVLITGEEMRAHRRMGRSIPLQRETFGPLMMS